MGCAVFFCKKCSGTLEMTCYEIDGEKVFESDIIFYIQGGGYYEKKIICGIYDRSSGIVTGNRMRFRQQ